MDKKYYEIEFDNEPRGREWSDDECMGKIVSLIGYTKEELFG